MENLSIQIPFCGFYDSEASHMIDREIESAFSDENGDCLVIPEEAWGGNKEYSIDYRQVEIELVKGYVTAFSQQYEEETGIELEAEFEEMASPREYNFTTDRIFALIPVKAVIALFTESEKDNHTRLAAVIKERCTSYDGFISSYSNKLEKWLSNPVLTWDHNELHILLEAVLSIHYDARKHGHGHFDTCALLEGWTCNGGLSDAVWRAMPEKLRQFADLQREYNKPLDFALWKETGKAHPDGSTREAAALPPLPCPLTLPLFPEARQ